MLMEAVAAPKLATVVILEPVEAGTTYAATTGSTMVPQAVVEAQIV